MSYPKITSNLRVDKTGFPGPVTYTSNNVMHKIL